MKKYLKWLLICVLFFTISVFLNECGHGLANALAIVGTVLFTKTKNEKFQYFGAALAIDNCLLRFIPCSLILFMPLVTGKPHIEDEYETGQLLVQLVGNGILLYVPALESWLITAVCLVITA